jgi:hypothetical protein
MLRFDNLRPGGALRWKAEDRRLGRSGSVMWKAAPVSVKGRWVDPHEQVLNVLIACQRYGLGKPSSRLSTEACLFPTASLVVVGEKLGTDPRTGQSSCCGLGREPFFLRVVDLFKSVDDYMKCCYALTA